MSKKRYVTSNYITPEDLDYQQRQICSPVCRGCGTDCIFPIDTMEPDENLNKFYGK